MTLRLRIVDDGSIDVDPGSLRLAPGPLDALGVDPGDVLRVDGERTTVAEVGRPSEALDEETVVLGGDVRRSVRSSPGETVGLTPTGTTAATGVRLAPTQSLQFEGGEEAIGRLLAGRHLLVGDRVRASLFGGSMTVTLVVTGLDPEGPATVTEDTTVELRSEPLEEDDDGDLTPASRDEVGGLDEALSELSTLVGVPLSAPDAYRTVGARPPNGVLIHGPTGVGKTLLVRVLAGETGATVHRVVEGDLPDRAAVDGIARTARREAPTILFVENLASVAPTPEGGGRTGEADRLGALLDRVADEPSVVVVGETDRVGDVDPSLRRGGRFDREIRIEVPTPVDRRAILEVLTGDLALSADVDLTDVADRTHGYVGADLSALVTEATNRAIARLPVDPDADRMVPGEFVAGLSVTRADLEAAMETVGPSALRGVEVERPDVGYDDIGGLDWAKREVVRAVEWPVRFPSVFDRLATAAPTGVLLYGPPGTGKTMLARAVASSTDANFIAVNGPELLDRYVGESERGVREVFERARETAPAVVFFDEVDSLAPERGGGNDTGAVERVVSQLLTELDGLEPRGDVVVIAATNRPDMVDRALLRPGRIEKTVEVPLPDRAAREEILAIHLADVPTADLDLEPLVEATEGYTGSDLAAVVREASLLAMETYLEAEDYSPDDASLAGLRVGTGDLERAVELVDPSVTEEMRRQYAAIAREFSGRRSQSSGSS